MTYINSFDIKNMDNSEKKDDDHLTWNCRNTGNGLMVGIAEYGFQGGRIEHVNLHGFVMLSQLCV